MYLITITGTRPLLLHSNATVDPKHPVAKMLAENNAIRGNKRTQLHDDERDYLKWYSGLYWNDQDGPVLPGANLWRCLVEAARLTKEGKNVERGLFVETIEARLEYDGPRDIKTMWNNGEGRFVDRRVVKIGMQKVIGLRPRFDAGWSASWVVDVDPEVLDPADLQKFAEKAGRVIRIGDYRQFFGGFEAKVVEV